LKIGFSTYSFQGTRLEDAIRSISEVGFEGVEVCVWKGFHPGVEDPGDVPWRGIRSLVEALGLTISAVGGHVSFFGSEGGWMPRTGEEAVETFKRSIDLAANLGVRVAETLSGTPPGETAVEEAWRLLAERVGECADYASSKGVQIGFEPHIEMLIDTPDKMLRLIGEVGSPSLKVNFDQSQFAVLGLDIRECAVKLAGYIVHTHLKDARGRYPDFEWLIPGEGEFDFKNLMLALRDAGYDGFLTTEVGAMRRSRPGYDPVQAARLTYKTMQRALTELGVS